MLDRNLHGSRTKLLGHENARLRRHPCEKSMERDKMSRGVKRITIRYEPGTYIRLAVWRAQINYSLTASNETRSSSFSVSLVAFLLSSFVASSLCFLRSRNSRCSDSLFSTTTRAREKEREEEGGLRVCVTTAFTAANEIFLITFDLKTKTGFVYFHIIVQPTKVTIEDVVEKF